MTEKTKSLGSLATTIDEMLASSMGVKGEAFTNAAAGLFELQQVSGILASIGVLAERRGLEVSAVIEASYALIISVSERLTMNFSSQNKREALALATQLEARRVSAIDQRRDRDDDHKQK